MKYLAIITISICMLACENQGKKKQVAVPSSQEACESADESKKVTFKGTIRSAVDSSALSMAFVLVPGTTIGTMSDPNGNYQINAPDGTKKLAFVMDGYEKATVGVSPEEDRTVFLNPKIN